jgi:predicted RNase H-like HicB family nuclease
MKIKGIFIKNGKWWVGWTNDVPGALTQGRTLKEAKENLIDAVREIKKTDNISFIPKKEIIVEEIEV